MSRRFPACFEPSGKHGHPLFYRFIREKTLNQEGFNEENSLVSTWPTAQEIQQREEGIFYSPRVKHVVNVLHF